MHFIITDAWLAKSRADPPERHQARARGRRACRWCSCWCAAGLYHWVFLKGAREGWPVVGTLVQLMVKDEFEQRDRFMRENIDAMARKLGEMQARLVQLEALGDRVSGLAGVNTADLKVPLGRGGALVSGRPLSLEELQATLSELDQLTGPRVDLLTVIESRLFDQKIRTMMMPTQRPVGVGHVGSAFGWRIDPFTGRRRCTPAWTSRPTPARPSSPPPAAWSSRSRCTRRTATWSRSTTATTWSPAMRMHRRCS